MEKNSSQESASCTENLNSYLKREFDGGMSANKEELIYYQDHNGVLFFSIKEERTIAKYL